MLLLFANTVEINWTLKNNVIEHNLVFNITVLFWGYKVGNSNGHKKEKFIKSL